MTARGFWEVGSTAVVVIAAVSMLGIYLNDRSRSRVLSTTQLVPIEGWEDWQRTGIRMGAVEPRVVVSTFTYFTCRFCRDLVPVLDSLVAAFPGVVAIEHHHFPLISREFSVQSAIASECAHEEGSFSAMYHTLYEQMDSLGLKPWEAMGEEAGIQELSGFLKCIQRPEGNFPRISAGRALGERIGVRGTPSVWVNGESFLGRTFGEFRQKVREVGIE